MIEEIGLQVVHQFPKYSVKRTGLVIQYPSDWIASTNGLADYTDLSAFYSPLQNISELFPARLKISVVPYSQNVSLPEYTNFVKTILNQSEQVDVRSSSEVTVADYPGYRVVLAERPFRNSSVSYEYVDYYWKQSVRSNI